MRTTKRFTPKVLERFLREQRGQGTYDNFISWHRVGRSDPSSLGRSHLLRWQGRHLELLSDGELVGSLFTVMLPTLADARMQFPLALLDECHELMAYDVNTAKGYFPGTVSIARKLGIKHPLVHGDGCSARWVMTTDQLLFLKLPFLPGCFIAVSIKPDTNWSERTRELLHLEAAYWKARNAIWLLITPQQYEQSVALTLRRSAPWGLSDPVNLKFQQLASKVVCDTLGHSYSYVIASLTDLFKEDDLAKRAFWQAVWSGIIPLDLRRGWRPHLPLSLLDGESFADLNPILAGRSAWI